MTRTRPGYPHYRVLWGDRASRAYLMHPALKVARLMRARGHNVTLVRSPQ